MKLLDRIRSFAATEAFMLVCFVLAYGSLAFGLPAVGVCLMAAILCVLFVITDDILIVTVPLLLLICLIFESFEKTWLLWLLIPLVITFGYRFVRNLHLSREAQNKYSLPGIIAVAVATTAAGLFTITPEEYFRPLALLNALSLGIFMIPIYLFFKGGTFSARPYRVQDRVPAIMYMLGVFLSCLILRLFIIHPELWHAENIGLAVSAYAWWRNGAATLTVMVLPFIFYFAVRHHPIHLLSVLFVYGAAVLSDSRGALVCGAIEIFICLFYFGRHQKKRRYIIWIFLGVCALLVAVFHRQFLELCHHLFRLTFDLELLLQEDRVLFAIRSIEDFFKNPIFGVGFGYLGNNDIHELVVNWYHSLLPQIVGGMGIVGARRKASLR